MTRRAVFAFAGLAAILPGRALHSFQQPAFRSGTLGVRVDVRVTDGRKPVAGLAAADFELRDNGVPQSLELIQVSDLPLNVIFALDVSGSTTGARQADLVAASEAALDGLKPGDRAGLTTFSHAVVPRVPLTENTAAVRAALQRLTPSGRTSILDAAYVALANTLAQPGRSLVLVCTDGADISSWLRPEEVIDSARRASAVVYAVTSADARRSAALEDLTDATGGDIVRVGSSRDMHLAFSNILQEFRSRYVLAYQPAGVPAGGFHRLDVRVKRRGLTVRARPGYIGLEPVK